METTLQFLSSQITIFALLIVIISFIISHASLPSIINISKIKNLMDEPGTRSSHITKTPTLGGVAIFISMIITISVVSSVISDKINLSIILPLLGSLTILFFLGLKDDLIDLNPKTKIIVQVVAALLIIIATNERITHFYGFLGIESLGYTASILFTVFVYVLIINAFNLIDGVDGLAGSIAIFSSLAFGTYFLIESSYTFVLISFSLAGAMFAFLRYNLSANNKIFMGDTGSMIVGFLLAFLAIGFLNMNNNSNSLFEVKNAALITIAILSFPLIDTTRVIIIRIKQKKSPFTADRNHIHHKLLNAGLTAKQVSAVAVGYSLLITLFAYNIDMNNLFSAGTSNTILLSICLPLYIKKNSIKNYLKKKILTAAN